MEIMKLVPTGKDYLWGGTRLREEYGKKIDMTPLAETWECSVHPDGPSYIANGEFKGVALADVLKQHPEYIGTKVEDAAKRESSDRELHKTPVSAERQGLLRLLPETDEISCSQETWPFF